jgi:ATPase subunit of ABC transporter with duplicated ATPase domains
VVLVSHDARLIRSAGFRLWVCDKQTVKEWPGEFEDYRDSLIAEIAEADKELEDFIAKRQAEEDAMRMAAARERARRVKELRDRAASTKAAAAAGAAAPAQ